MYKQVKQFIKYQSTVKIYNKRLIIYINSINPESKKLLSLLSNCFDV